MGGISDFLCKAHQELFSTKEIAMKQHGINSATARATCGFVVLILLNSVFTFIVGGGGQGATSSGQAAHLEPGTGDTVYLPGIADVTFIDSSHAWAINQQGTALYEVRESASVELKTEINHFADNSFAQLSRLTAPVIKKA